MDAKELARIGQQITESLRHSGVEWLPRTASIPDSPIPTNMVTEPTSPVAAPCDTSSNNLNTSTGPTLNADQKRIALQTMNDNEVRPCTKCSALVANRTQTVFGVGNIDTELVFVGEAPGADEDKQGEPFVGQAGQLLNKIIDACKLKREEIYICNVLKCRPPSNRPPQVDEISNCRCFLERQIEIIRPKFICCLGTHAAQTLLKSTMTIGKLRKTWHDYRGAKLIATYHPSYLLRNPAAKKDVWEDMKMMMDGMGRPVL